MRHATSSQWFAWYKFESSGMNHLLVRDEYGNNVTSLGLGSIRMEVDPTDFDVSLSTLKVEGSHGDGKASLDLLLKDGEHASKGTEETTITVTVAVRDRFDNEITRHTSGAGDIVFRLKYGKITDTVLEEVEITALSGDASGAGFVYEVPVKAKAGEGADGENWIFRVVAQTGMQQGEDIGDSPSYLKVKYIEPFTLTTIIMIGVAAIAVVTMLYFAKRMFSSSLSNADVLTEMQEIQTNMMCVFLELIDHTTDWINYWLFTSTSDYKIYYQIFLGTGLASTIFSVGVNIKQIMTIVKSTAIAPDDELTEDKLKLEKWGKENNIDEELKADKLEAQKREKEEMERLKKGNAPQEKKRKGTVREQRSRASMRGTQRRKTKRGSITPQITSSGSSALLGTIATTHNSTARGSILESMAVGMHTRRENVLHATRKALLVLLRTRDEHCVDKFLVERMRTRSLVGFTVVLCEGLPIAFMNVQLLVYGCTREDMLAQAQSTGTTSVDANLGTSNLVNADDDSSESTFCDETENADDFLLFVLVLVMSVLLVGWKLKDLYDIWNMNRRIKQLTLLIEVETEDAFDLLESAADLEDAVESEKKGKEDMEKQNTDEARKLSGDIEMAVKQGGTAQEGNGGLKIGTFSKRDVLGYAGE